MFGYLKMFWDNLPLFLSITSFYLCFQFPFMAVLLLVIIAYIAVYNLPVSPMIPMGLLVLSSVVVSFIFTIFPSRAIICALASMVIFLIQFAVFMFDRKKAK